MGTGKYFLIEEEFQNKVLNTLERLEALYSGKIKALSSTNEDILMDTVDLQNYLKCCRRTLLKHRKAGLPFVQRENGRIYYWKSEVDQYFNKPKNNII